MTASRWQFWIDRGGTFTDIVARAPDGALRVRKLLSQAPGRYEDPVIEGIRELLGTGPGLPIDAALIDTVKIGTTVGTNALLERRGEGTLLAITRGFGDALRIAYQNRPNLFDRRIVLPEPLYGAVAEIDERMMADGTVRVPLDEAAAEAALQTGYAAGFRAVAIVLMHGYRYPSHEAALARIARRIGFQQISVSHETTPLMKLVARGETTVVDAYLSPVVRRYAERVAASLGGSRLLFMQSNGGLVEAARFRGKDAVLSGPAGGVVGMARTGSQAGFDKLIGFDMGGTSTDVSHYAGGLERTLDTEIGGVRLRQPMLDIHTVAAGGGSICRFDGARFRVGPESAGAVPGPACYRLGGPLTVTDCNLLLGRIQPDFFPRMFGPAGDQPVDRAAAEAAARAVASQIERATGRRLGLEEIAAGFVHIAVETMASAIKRISIERGHDVTGYTLACFGGAGGQHACAIADNLGIARVFIHPLAGVLSAYGIGLADLRVVRQRTIEAPLDAMLAERLDRIEFPALEADCAAAMAGQRSAADPVQILRRVRVRYQGSDAGIDIAHGTEAEIGADFAAAHRRKYGFDAPDKRLIVEAAEIEMIASTAPDGDAVVELAPDVPAPTPTANPAMLVDGDMRPVPLFRSAFLRPGQSFAGPAIIADESSTTVIDPGWGAALDPRGNLVIERRTPRDRGMAIGTDADPIMLEIFNNLFMSIAEQMGVALRNTAHSVNIKERLDFSCALFDADAALIANAPHMPVHLGSMGESVATLIRSRGARRDGRGMLPGDVYALNAPYNGGTHLPDITVVMPVFAEAGSQGEVLFYVAARGHHADIGGITPGSMPPMSRSVEEEGVLIDDFLLVDAGEFREAAVLDLLGSGAFPARNPAQNLADLKAQIAACAKGAAELHHSVRHFGLATVRAYMRHVQDNAAEAVSRAIAGLTGGSFKVEMDDGPVVAVTVTIDREARTAIVDFAGTSAEGPNNFNAPSSICQAAVLYVFRTLVDDAIPMNGGCLRPVEIRIPPASMLSPRYPAAVVAGNVETSQCITDALYGALGIMAASQGTMNNLTFGTDRYQYYETICGGSGAGPGFDGTDAVHTHMTNSRLTDPEVLEWRFPVLLDRFEIRRGSGGEGRWRGGDGVVRRLRFLEPMLAAILSNRRIVPPYGLAGGQPGQLGRNWVERRDGIVEDLPGVAIVAMAPDEIITIETPGGGGYGAVTERITQA
jgi:5-oxoprolinase (ATP-hydrolysing)